MSSNNSNMGEYHLHLPDMSCRHCEKAVTAAVMAIDPQALIQIDLPQHLVRLHTSVTLDTIQLALADAGYPAQLG